MVIGRVDVSSAKEILVRTRQREKLGGNGNMLISTFKSLEVSKAGRFWE